MCRRLLAVMSSGHRARRLAGVALVAASWVTSLSAQTTIRVNVDDAGIESPWTMGLYPDALSPDGRFALFRGIGMVSGFPQGYGIIRDIQEGVNDVFNMNYLGKPSYGQLGSATTASAGGRFVAFSSNASDLVPGDNNYDWDVFVRDRLNGTTERISVDPWGNEVYDQSDGAWISADGSRVAFVSWADGLVVGDNNGSMDVFVRDLPSATTVNLSSSGAQPTYPSSSYCALCNPNQGVAISADGRYVAFGSWADNFVAGDTNGLPDIFVRDTWAGTTICASVSPAGAVGNQLSHLPTISADGRFVAFDSSASNLVPGDMNGKPDVFVHDTLTNTTMLASVSSTGVYGNKGSVFAQISGDGRVVAFFSECTNLVAGDTNNAEDVFAHSMVTGTTWRVSVTSSGGQIPTWGSGPAGIDFSGDAIAFVCQSALVVAGDTNAEDDLFLRYSHSSCAPIVGYCSPKKNSVGCTPAIGSTGLPSLSGSATFRVTATGVVHEKPGLLILGTAPASKPFANGTLCVALPALRLPAQVAPRKHTPAKCNGYYSYELDPTFMVAHGLSPGLTVYAQFLCRDPGFPPPDDVSLTAGLQFTVCP
jgi:Tol biopolymer transport system component